MPMNEQKLKDEFRNFAFGFPFLKPDEIDVIVENTVLQEFKKGHLLLKEGSVAKECHAIIRGCVREYYLKDGLEKTTAFYTEGDAVNAFSSFSNKTPSKQYLECSEDCLLTVGNQSLIDEMCELVPRLSEFIKLEVEKDTGRLQDRMAKFMISTPEERFKDLMENNKELINRVPQHQIASYIGVTPESFSRIRKRVLLKEK